MNKFKHNSIFLDPRNVNSFVNCKVSIYYEADSTFASIDAQVNLGDCNRTIQWTNNYPTSRSGYAKSLIDYKKKINRAIDALIKHVDHIDSMIPEAEKIDAAIKEKLANHENDL